MAEAGNRKWDIGRERILGNNEKIRVTVRCEGRSGSVLKDR